MELHVEQQQIPCFLPTAKHRLEEPFHADCVVPDALPDAGALLLAEGDLCLWRLDIEQGGATIEGEVSVRVCYLPEEGGAPVSLPLSVPVLLRVRGEDIVPGLRPFDRCRITDLQAQLIHSRKLRVQGRARCDFVGYAPGELSLTVGLGEGERGIFTRKTPCAVQVVSAVEEQVFTAAETIPLRLGAPSDGQLLSHSSVPVLSETQLLDGRVILQGRVVTELLYLDPRRGELVSETVETPFSQLMEPGGELPIEQVRATLHLTSESVRCRADEAAVETELHLVAQIVCVSCVQTDCVTDAYSVRGALTPEWEEVPFTATASGEEQRLFLEGMIPCETAGTAVCVSRAALHCERAAVTVLLRDGEGRLSARTGELPLELPEGAQAIPEPLSVTPGAEGLSLRLPVRVETVQTETRTLRQISCAVLEETEEPENRPGVTLVRRDKTTEFWETAKAHGSSEAAIRAANPETEEPTRWMIVPAVRG